MKNLLKSLARQKHRIRRYGDGCGPKQPWRHLPDTAENGIIGPESAIHVLFNLAAEAKQIEKSHIATLAGQVVQFGFRPAPPPKTPAPFEVL
jgi:hypothetical protein